MITKVQIVRFSTVWTSAILVDFIAWFNVNGDAFIKVTALIATIAAIVLTILQALRLKAGYDKDRSEKRVSDEQFKQEIIKTKMPEAEVRLKLNNHLWWVNLFKQLKFAVIGEDGKMQFKELGALVLLASFIFLLITRAFFNVIWENVWIEFIIGGFIVNVFGNLTYNYFTKLKNGSMTNEKHNAT